MRTSAEEAVEHETVRAGTRYPLDLTLERDIFEHAVMSAFVTGAQAYARRLKVSDSVPVADLVPDGAVLARELVGEDSRQALYRGDAWTLAVSVRPEHATKVLFTASSEELANEIAARIRLLDPEPEDPENTVAVHFWCGDGSVMDRLSSVRRITAARWSSIRQNYPGDVASALDRLAALDSLPADGKLVLMHGAPGTGKTTFLRSVALMWGSWSEAHVVLDAERFFSDPMYLIDIMNPSGVRRGNKQKVPIIFIEDADEFLRPDAKASAGHALGRLLNLTDGMLGQGLAFLIVITTNEPLTGLHPAVVRPGRCLAAVEFRRFTAREASAWLGRPHRGDASLAELLRESDQLAQVATVDEPAVPIGQYL